MFVDEAKVYVKAGNGGDGCNSFYRDRVNRIGSPDGGPGGGGGNIIFEADVNVHTLLDFQYRQHFKGNPGGHGGSNNKKGARGEDIYIKVPQGTIIKDSRTDLVLRDLVEIGEHVIAAKGGEGGRGNSRGRASEKGSPGEEKTLLLELKAIADVGIVGYPNAGKSTLISRLSNARPKIASYPFTTKEPVLGVLNIGAVRPVVIADIPGLIEDAHKGKGLGDRFLRHIERTKLLIHLIDVSAFEGRDPCEAYLNLNKELKLYSKELIKKPQIIALNKMDLPQAKDNVVLFKKRIGKRVFPISALTGNGMKGLLAAIHKELLKFGE